MTLKKEFYDYVLGKNTAVTWQKQALFEIIGDLTDRRGLSQGWDEIDGDIQEEILESWLEIIVRKSTYA